MLSELYNERSNSYLSVLMEDGKIYDTEGLRVAGINGIISLEHKYKRGS